MTELVGNKVILQDNNPGTKFHSKKETFLFQNSISLRKEKGDRRQLELLFQLSRDLIGGLPIKENMQRLSWKVLFKMIRKTGENKGYSAKKIDASIQWITFLKEKNSQLNNYFKFPYTRLLSPQNQIKSYVKIGNVLVTPGISSMWDHCSINFEKQLAGWKIELVSGYKSPSYQAYLLSKTGGTLDEALLKTPPPYYSRHQLNIPDVRVNLRSTETGQMVKPWGELYRICKPFGFSPSYPNQPGLEGELKFPGIQKLYGKILSNPLIPRQISHLFFKAMEKTGFYPSPSGLRIIFALSAQESTIQWNPRLADPKKKLLRKRLLNVLSRIDTPLSGTVSNMILSPKEQNSIKTVLQNFKELTLLESHKVREYDFYIWSRNAYELISNLLEKHHQVAQYAKWLFDLESFKRQIEYEPQTFGLWQINVNQLQGRIQSFKQLRRVFPELFQKVEGTWTVDRERLITVLSGMPSSKINRERTLELIIFTYLQPRYMNHLLGEKNDMFYFITENMSGEMSTFRAAIQQELNKKMGSHLVCDGDLTYFYPYSTKIDWSRRSNTVNQLFRFIENHQYYFESPVNPGKLVRELCVAQTWDELKDLELYLKIMGKKRGLRIYPQIKSSLYDQMPQGYTKTVIKKSYLF